MEIRELAIPPEAAGYIWSGVFVPTHANSWLYMNGAMWPSATIFWTQGYWDAYVRGLHIRVPAGNLQHLLGKIEEIVSEFYEEPVRPVAQESDAAQLMVPETASGDTPGENEGEEA